MALQPLDSFILSRQQLGRAAFRETLSTPMLAVFAPETDGVPQFKTATHCGDIAGQANELARAQLGHSARGAYAAPLLKRDGSPWESRISVGRAGNTDVCIPDVSLSKLHAHFIETDEGEIFVIDAGSKNGTRVNGRTIEPREPFKVDMGDTLQLGSVVVVLHSPTTFFHFVLVLDAAGQQARQRAERRAAAAAQIFASNVDPRVLPGSGAPRRVTIV